jgi:thiol:disulfide interchange protein DsbC
MLIQFQSQSQGFVVKNIFVLLAALLLSASVHADPAIKKALEARFPDLKVEKLTKSGYGGLYEVFAGGEMFYTDEKVTFVLLGQMVDAKTRENVTEARLRKLNAIAFDSLPLDQAIKTVLGNGSRRIAVFSDPYCGYCKRFEPDVLAMKDVTIYTFLLPIIRPESAPMSKKVWCSTDRVKAWQDIMLRNTEPTSDGACETPVEKVLALGQMLRINGTPTTFFEDGERISGAISRDMLEKKIAQSSPAKK